MPERAVGITALAGTLTLTLSRKRERGHGGSLSQPGEGTWRLSLATGRGDMEALSRKRERGMEALSRKRREGRK
jgi:hypothetical protein